MFIDEYFDTDNVVTEIYTEENSYVILHCDQFMKDNDDSFICIFREKDEQGYYEMVCDDKFMSLPFQVRKYMIWHEIGHIECQPVRRIQDEIERDNYRVQCILDGGVMDEETEADEYALEGWPHEDIIQLIFDLQDFMWNHVMFMADVPRIEFNRRIDHMIEILNGMYNGEARFVA